MGSRFWTREITEVLIREIKAREHLYNQSHFEYRDRKKRVNSIGKICAAINFTNHKFCSDCVKKKIQTLRWQYSKEKRLVDESLQNDGNIYTPSLWCYEQLDFLSHHIKIGSRSRYKRKTLKAAIKEENSFDVIRTHSKQIPITQFVPETVDDGDINRYFKYNSNSSPSNPTPNTDPTSKQLNTEEGFHRNINMSDGQLGSYLTPKDECK